MRQHTLFIHIPKTAGTSFRTAAQSYFGEDSTLLDYGKGSKETSKTVLETIYNQQNFYKFSKQINQYQNLFLSGHIPVKKYMSLFKSTDVVTFVREPIAQVVSHYAHFKTHNGYDRPLQEFVQEKRFSDLQSRMLQAKPLELFGFVGLTEEYEKSLEIINYYFGTQIEHIEANKNESSNTIKASLGQETIELIQKHNQADIALYEKAKELFNAHKKAYEAKEPYMYKLIQGETQERVAGVAYYRESNEVAIVEVRTENDKIKRVQAKDFKPGLLAHKLPRDGYVGFIYKKEHK